MGPRERHGAAGRHAAHRVLQEPEAHVRITGVGVPLQGEVDDLVAVGSCVPVAYVLTMSILSPTLASWLHCHPLIGSVSLLPVAYVVLSLVLKVPLALSTKSRSKPRP